LEFADESIKKILKMKDEKKFSRKNKLVRVKEKKFNMKISQILPYIKKFK
jgi:hypothetical protein